MGDIGFGPDETEDLQCFVHAGTAVARRGRKGLELQLPPTGADAQRHPATGQLVTVARSGQTDEVTELEEAGDVTSVAEYSTRVPG